MSALRGRPEIILAAPDQQLYVRALREGLKALGWVDGKNIQVEYRWARGDADSLKSDVASPVPELGCLPFPARSLVAGCYTARIAGHGEIGSWKCDGQQFNLESQFIFGA